MTRVGLGARLTAFGILLLVAATLGIAVPAERLLGRLAEEQALARVRLAGASAREALGRRAQELATSAHLLADRPTLARLLDSGDVPALQEFLERFGAAGGMTACAVAADLRVVAASRASVPWDALLSAAAYGPALAEEGGELYLVAESPLPGRAGATVAVRRVDRELLAEIGAQVGLAVRLVGRREAMAAYGDAHARVLADAVERGEAGAVRNDVRATFDALEPLRLGSGDVGAVLETALPTADVEASLAKLRRRLVALATVLVVAVSLASAIVARSLTGPLRDLAAAAVRVGRGDLATPVARGGAAEVDALADVMEEMRRRLGHLTDDLRRREAEATAVLSGISEGVLTVDLDRRVRFANPAASRWLPDEASEGRLCGDLLHPMSAPADRPCEDRCPIVAARSRGAAQAVERLVRPDGVRVVTVSAAPPEGGRQVVLLRDETEAEAGRRMRDAILANVSHELRTPLAAQLASLELMADRLEASDARGARELMRAMERGTRRLTRLVDNLLESVRIEAGHEQQRRGVVHLDDVVEEAVAQMLPLIDGRGQRVDVALPHPLPEVTGDGPRLVQVMVNLLANANKYAPEGSTIRVGAEAGPGGVALWVDDEGPGLPPGAGVDLFQPFVRAGGREPEQAGAGLGLWVVRSIVERHGGRVDAAPAERGTRIRIVLPVAGSGGHNPEA